MKKIFITLMVFCFGIAGFAQSESMLFRLVYMEAKAGHVKDFEAKLAEHNKKYHTEGMMRVQIDAVLTGKNMGKYSWIQGPMKWSDMDEKKEDEGHDKHWAEEVMPFIESVEDDGFWRTNEKFGYWPENSQDANKTLITYFDLVRGKESKFYDLFEKVIKVYKEKEYENGIFLAGNQFNNGDGRDVAVVTFFEKFNFLERDDKFVKDFEEIHGPGSWHGFMNDFLESTNSGVDELRVSRKDLGGQQE